jgi:hypothetical protein
MAKGFTERSVPGLSSSQDDLVRALTGCDLQADLAVSRTRRNVQSTVINMGEERQTRRRNAGLVLLASLLFLTLLVPALWSSVDTFAAGSHFADMQTQSYLLGVMLFPGIIVAAIAVFTRQRNQGRRQS